MSSELVRLKALDTHFSKMKKFFILPQSPLISEGIEEGLRKDPTQNCDFNASSITSEIKGD